MGKGISVEQALQNRKSRVEEERRSSVEQALEDRKKRISSEMSSIGKDLMDRYNTSVANYNSYEESYAPKYGMDIAEELGRQRDISLSNKQLISDVEAYRSYIGDEKADAMLDNLRKISEGYKYSLDNFEYFQKMDYDLDAGKADLDGLNSAIEEYDGLRKSTPIVSRASSDGDKQLEKIRNNTARQQEILSSYGYDSYSDMKDDYAKKSAYYNQAKLLQGRAKISNDALSAPDFREYADKGAAIENPSMNDAEGWLVIGGGLWSEDNDGLHIGGKKVGNIVTYSRENADAIQMGGAGMVGDEKYRHMTNDEVDIYNYYLAKEKEGLVDKGSAQKYLDSIEDALNQRSAGQRASTIEDKPALEFMFGVEAGLDQFRSGISNLFNTDDDYIAPTKTQYTSALVREDLSDVGGQFLGSSIGQGAYDLITTTTNMMPSILASTVVGTLNPVAGTAVGAGLMGGSAAGNAYQEMLNAGYDKDQARVYSALTGASEAGLQYALGGIGKLGGKLSGKSINAIASGINNAGLRFAVKFGGEMASEGVEEFMQDVLDPYFKSIATGEIPENVDWEQAFYSGMLGALSAGVLNGVNAGINKNAEVSEAKRIIKSGNKDALVDVGKTFDAETIAYKLADKVTPKTGAWKLSQLLHEVNANLGEQTQADIKNALVQKGMTETDAGSISKWLAKAVDGGNLTRLQQKALEENDVISSVFKEVVLDRNSTVNQRLHGMMNYRGIDGTSGIDFEAIEEGTTKENLSKQATSHMAMQKASEEAVARMLGIGQTRSKNDFSGLDNIASDIARHSNSLGGMKTKSTIDSVKESIASERKVSAEEGTSVKKIQSIKDGKMMLELTDGSVVDSKDVVYNSDDQALLYESVLSMGYSAESANAIVNGYSALSGISASQYLLGVNEAYNYGKIGYPLSSIKTDGFISDLTDTQKSFAYGLGRADADGSTKSAQNFVNRKKTDAKRKGRVVLSASVSNMTDIQKASISAIGRVVADVTHNNVVIYESVAKDGRRVFSKDIAGHKAGESAPNGFYDPNTGAIYIDINAGNNGEGAMLWTVAHEMTHFIRQWSPEKFKVLADFLMKEYGKNGVDVQTLIENQIAKANRAGRNLSFDAAYEEVVADSMSSMFTDTNMSEKLAKLKAQDQTLWEKMKGFFADLYNRIKEAYKGLKPQTQEAMYVKRMMDSVERISDMFAEALVDAGESFMSSDYEISGVSMEYTVDDAMSGTDVSDITRKPVQKLQERTEYEKHPKEMINITSSGAVRSPMAITINGKTFNGDASVRELRNARFAENGFKPKDILRINEFLDKMRDYLKVARVQYQYVGLQDVYDAKIIISPTTGKIVLSGLVNNGDYEINFDFTKTCKKRIALQEVIEQLAMEKGRVNDDGTITEVNLSEENIRHINEVLANYGIETACLCCFVESKRYAMQSHFQEKVCDVWNRLVDEVNAEEGITKEAEYFDFAGKDIQTSKIADSEFDRLYAEMTHWRNSKYEDEGGEGAIERKMKAFLKNSHSARKKLRLSDFVTESGRTNLHKLYPDIESLAKAKIGTALPKAVEAFAPYNGEIELMSVSGKEDISTYAKKIAGARSQSFSDFIMAHIYDVLQKTASLTARKIPAHTYTKEISRARLFGMTGEKTNMSVLHEIDPDVDSWSAGLKADGTYYVSDYDAFRNGLCHQIQSIPDAESIALQNDPRYSKDCGRIGVGFSYLHMLMLHNDPDIRQVIGYHTSSLPYVIKPLTNLDKAADYTGVQNTLKFKGFKKPNYAIPEGVPSYATPPQDIMAYDEKGKPISKFSNVADASFDIKGTYKELCKTMESTKAAKETLRLLLQYAEENGLYIETSKAEKGHGKFDLYGDTEKTQNPYQTADNYIEYCISSGMIPMFYEFALNDNYYKDIYDFNVFDRLSYNPETGLHEDTEYCKAYAPQLPVHMINEDGTLAFPEDFWELVDKYMKDYNYQREDFAKKFPEIMKDVRAIKDNQGNPMEYRMSERDIEPIAEETYEELKQHFGTTNNFRVAGYLLKDGTMLDFSGKHWGDTTSDYRQVDHRDVNEVLDDADNYDAMVQMIGDGNIRLMPESGGINLSVMPTTKQIGILEKYIRNFKGEVLVDFDEPGGDTVYSRNYNKGTDASTILRDIENYFRGGKQSELMQFHASDEDVLYSDRVTDKETLEFLDDQLRRGEVTEVFRAMQLVDGKLYPPMAGTVNGKWQNPSEFNTWEMSREETDFDKAVSEGRMKRVTNKKGETIYKYKLVKGKVDGIEKGTDVWADYAPYIHTSLSALNDQFTSAYKRPNLVVVRGYVPNSEVTGGYKAYGAKKSVGETKWHSGVVAAQMPDTRRVILSRYFMPIEIVDDSIVAQEVKKSMKGKDIEIPFNVVTPKLRRALEDIGVRIGDSKGLSEVISKESVKYSNRDSYEEIANDIVSLYNSFNTYDYWDEMNGSEDIEIADQLRRGDTSIIDRIKEDYEEFDDNEKKIADSIIRRVEGETKYSDRDDSSLDTRTLLSNALATTAQNEIESKYITQYQEKIATINAEQKRLAELRARIKELSFAKGTRDAEQIRKLQEEATKIANRISTYDKQLLKLEATKPLRQVLDREKAKAKKKAEKEGREALDAYRERAARTQRELMDRYQTRIKNNKESRERTELRHKILKKVKELNDLLLNGDANHHVPLALQKYTADALSAINKDTVNAENRIAILREKIARSSDPDKIAMWEKSIDRIELQGENMREKLDALDRAYREIKDSKNPLIANAYDDGIQGMITTIKEEVGDTPLREMTKDQLEMVHDMYKAILHTIRTSNKAFKAARQESISELGSKVANQIILTGGKKKYVVKALESIKKFGWDNMKPIYAMKTLGSETLLELFNNVRAGEDTWAVDVTEAREYFLDKAKKYGYKDWDFDTRYSFVSKSGKEFALNLQEIMSLYAYSKREQADLHLSMGGFVFEDSTVVIKKKGVPVEYKINVADAHNISFEVLQEITRRLTDEQKAFVDEMQSYMSNELSAKGNEVSIALYDIDLFREKNYFPLKSAKQYMFEKNEAAGEVRLKNSGFTKKTVRNANNPIVLRGFMDVWAGHVNDMAMYHAFVLPLEDFNRVWNYKTPTSSNLPTESVKMAIQNAYGDQANKYISQMLTDLNGGARSGTGAGIINKMTSLFKKGAVFASASVVIQQPSAIARAWAYIEPKYFAKTIASAWNPKKHKSNWEEVKKYAPIAIIKEMGYFDTNMGRQTTDWITSIEYEGRKEKLIALFKDGDYRDEVLSKAPAIADEITWSHIWNAVKEEVADTTDIPSGTDEFFETCGKRFTEVIVNTQVYDSVLSRSALMRSKDTGAKMATAFMAEPTTSINMIADALLQAKRGGDSKRARRVIGSVVAQIIINSAIVSLVYAARDDDDEKTYAEKYVKSLSGSVIDGLNPLSMIPFGRDIMSIIQGYDVERSDMTVIANLYKSWQNLFKDSYSPYKKFESFVGSVANMFGIPLKNLMRDGRAIWNIVEGIMSDNKTTAEGLKYALIEGVTGDSKYDQIKENLFKSINNNDNAEASKNAKALVDYYVSKGKTEKDAKTSARTIVTKEVKDDFLIAYKSGDNETMASIRRMLKSTGLYDDVVKTTQDWIKNSKK